MTEFARAKEELEVSAGLEAVETPIVPLSEEGVILNVAHHGRLNCLRKHRILMILP